MSEGSRGQRLLLEMMRSDVDELRSQPATNPVIVRNLLDAIVMYLECRAGIKQMTKDDKSLDAVSNVIKKAKKENKHAKQAA
jgi:hypothetical protein